MLPSNDHPSTEHSMIISYMTLRKAVGVLGMVMPIVLAIGYLIAGGGAEIKGSISHYYHSPMRDFFVGLLCAVGLFMFCYKGPEKVDGIAGNLAGIFAIGTALLPTYNGDTPVDAVAALIGQFHLAAATALFLVLSYFSLCLFTKTKPDQPPGRMKLRRNRVYRICGFAILVFLALIALYLVLLKGRMPWLDQAKPVFWLETLALWAFGFSWLTKGELILGD
ncbi:MAG: hypothetical protein JPMHGGIA_00697 [Saprospiraceae bacterium]|nr:hypothetical protein [Saprospiraceae bacterium]